MPRRSFLLCFLTGLAGCMSGSSDMSGGSGAAALMPIVTAPQKRVDKPEQVWGTLYYVHKARESNGENSVPLRGPDGRDLGASLSLRDWCNAAQEGTVAVETSSRTNTFNHAGWGQSSQADCTTIFPYVASTNIARFERTVFAKVPKDAPQGLGSDSRFRLVPYRTVAVDKSRFPLGTVLYIPQLKGRETPAGIHDGYVFAADTGVGVSGNHLDFFIGKDTRNPAPDLFASTSTTTFEAFVVTDQTVVRRLRAMHLRS